MNAPVPETAPVLAVEGLGVLIRQRDRLVPVLEDVSFTVARGETIGIVGESGCGKSMTARAVMGLLPDTARACAGAVHFGGRDLLKERESYLRKVRGRDMAMIFQEPQVALNPLLTIGQQVAEPLRLHRGESRSQAQAHVIELLQLVGIADAAQRARQYPHQISGGMCQRVMIAIALAARPQLLIADEPTTALDVTIQAQILDLLARLQQEENVGVVLISHDLGVIGQMARHALVMYAGRVVESGPVADLFDRPLHPYTEGLLNALPRSGQAGGKLYAIPGMIPPLGTVKQGCRFAARCPLVEPECLKAEPPLLAMGEGRAVRCWVRAAEGGGAS